MSWSEKPFFGELLQQFRKRKRLNQKQLAELIGVSRETVSLWERGYYKPETDTILYELCKVRVLGLTEQEQQQLFEAYTVTALASSFHNPPLERNPYFTGRSPQLTDLHTLLMAGKQVALTQAISGLGGIGKTQLALEYAYRYQKSYHDIFWLVADTYELLMTSYIRLAALLLLPEHDEPDQSKVKAAVHHWLSKHTGWLLILDNVEDLSLVHQFVPVDRQGAVLLTTRRQVTEPVAQALELGILPENDGILFLLKRTKILNFDMSLDDASTRDIAAARTITRALGNLPLALDQASAYILETGYGFANYLDLFRKHQAELLQRRAGEEIPTDHPESVTTTFTLNFQQVQQRSEVAGDLLRVCAFLASENIGEEILVQGASELGSILQPLGSDGLLLNQAMEVLRTFSLIQRNPEEKTLSVHRLVQAVLQNTMPASDQEMWIGRVISAVNSIFPDVEHTTWSQCERLVPHALTCATHTQSPKSSSLDLAALLSKTALYLNDRAQHTEAEPLYQRALHIREQALGPDHPDVAFMLNNLAVCYRQQGKYTEAEPLLQRAVHISEQALGLDHPDVAYPLNVLAVVYEEQGKFAEAEPLYQRTLQIREQALGPDHPDVAFPLNGLAVLYSIQGKYAEAEPLYQRALHIWEQTLGPDHPQVAPPLLNLALLYQNQGKFAEAEWLYQRTLHISEQALGPDHPQVARVLNSLALLYQEQGKYAEAEPLYRRALYIWEQALGTEHPDVAYALNGLANLYSSQSKYTEAEPLYQRALQIREQALGPNHPHVAFTLHCLAELYREQGKYAEAEPLYRRALYIWEQALGTEHPDVAYALNGLANLYSSQSKYTEAEPLYQRALQIREYQEYHLGSQDPGTAEVLHDFAAFHHTLGNRDKAESLYERALVIRAQTLGPQHPKTMETQERYITLLREMGRQGEIALLETHQFERTKTEEEREE